MSVNILSRPLFSPFLCVCVGGGGGGGGRVKPLNGLSLLILIRKTELFPLSHICNVWSWFIYLRVSYMNHRENMNSRSLNISCGKCNFIQDKCSLSPIFLYPGEIVYLSISELVQIWRFKILFLRSTVKLNPHPAPLLLDN